MSESGIRRDKLSALIAERFGGRQVDFCRAVGMSTAQVGQWLGGYRNMSDRSARHIEQALGLPRLWMDGPADGISNTAAGPALRSRVPLISWARAGDWSDIDDPYPPGVAEEWVVVPTQVGPNAFALRVVGDSMEPRIADGAVVVIDPAREARHGSVVLAKRTADQRATLKQLWYDGGTPMLRPANDRYPMLDMPPDTRIIGVAVAAVMEL